MSKKGKQTGTATSAQLLAGDPYRGYVTIVLHNAVPCALGFSGEEALLDEGIVLASSGDTVSVFGELAREQINVIGNTASLTWQEGPVLVARN